MIQLGDSTDKNLKGLSRRRWHSPKYKIIQNLKGVYDFGFNHPCFPRPNLIKIVSNVEALVFMERHYQSTSELIHIQIY
ncbi:hypothetical protein Bca4012_083680 [Brassica carinata]